MKKIYIAGAISSPVLEEGLKNLQQGIKAGAEVLKMGLYPYVPHLDYQFNLVQEDHIPVDIYYKYDLAWLEVCDCMLVLPGYEKSKGVAAEIDFAKKNKIPIFYSMDDIKHLAGLSELQQDVLIYEMQRDLIHGK